MDSLVRLVLIGLVVAGLVWFFRGGGGSYTWRLSFRHGRLVETDGHVPARVRAAFSDVGRDAHVSGDVTLRGTEQLRFSRSIAPEAQQRFRNVWAAVR